MSEFEGIMKRSWDDVPTELLIPQGTWVLRGENALVQPRKDEPSQVGSFLFIYSPSEPTADVDQDELDKLGEYDYSENRIFVKFWINGAGDWDNVRRHLAKHGIDLKGRSVEEACAMVKGSIILAYLGVDTYVDIVGESQEKNVATAFAPVDD